MGKWRNFWVAAMTLVTVALVVGAGCAGGTASSTATTPSPPSFDQARAWSDLQKQVNFGFRVPGTQAHRDTRDWLVAQLTPCATAVTLQPFTHKLGGVDVQMWNIIATIPGNGTAPRQQVLLCAHWDTRPTADYDPDPAKRTQPIPGANDGASGVAVLLEVARQLHAHPIARDVVVVLFDGEDYGPTVADMLLGSKYYATHLPAKKPDWGVLLDMVGDKNLKIPREVNSDQQAKAVNDRIFRAARELGYTWSAGVSGFADSTGLAITDDHTNLNAAGVPTVDLIDFDYPPWHTTGDDLTQCSAESLRLVGKTVLYALQLP